MKVRMLIDPHCPSLQSTSYCISLLSILPPNGGAKTVGRIVGPVNGFIHVFVLQQRANWPKRFLTNKGCVVRRIIEKYDGKEKAVGALRNLSTI